MLRLSPAGKERISQSDLFEKHAGGSEFNVVSGLSLLGLRTGIVTKLPDNEIGKYIRNRVRFCGVRDDYIIYDQDPQARLGIYYCESGAHPRKPCVVYDRRLSSVTGIRLDEIPEKIYGSTRLFHVSGISLALDEGMRAVVVEMLKRFKESGTLISFDVNYRASLWSEQEARSTIESILSLVDILFVSEETSRRMLARTGSQQDILKGYCNEYGIGIVASSERKVISPTKHSFGSTIYCAHEDSFYREDPYNDIEVVDRIGSGDAYLAGALYGLLQFGSCQKALEYGNAMAAVKNTIPGDLPATDVHETEKIIESHKGIGFQSEMNR
jgi:2-dehydro-3-deoxygluconokinase